MVIFTGRKSLPVWMIIFGLLLLTACSAAQPTTPAGGTALAPASAVPLRSPPALAPGAPRVFAFSSPLKGQLQIHLADSGGNYLKQLTTEGDSNTCPAYSPDGSRIAFCSNRSGKDELFIMDSDGSNQRRLAGEVAGCTCSVEAQISWSPDGQWIALPVLGEGNQDLSSYDLFAVRADGSAAANLTAARQRYGGPVWNPDSRSVLFGGQVGGVAGIYQVDVASQKITLFTGQAIAGSPAGWSPDGQTLLYVAGGQGWADIFSQSGAGGQPARLTHDSKVNFFPRWFPDGQRILFISSRTGDEEIFVMNRDGSGQTNLTQNPGVLDAWPALSPDGAKIVYLTLQNNQWDSWVMNADGSGKKKMTDAVDVIRFLSWKP